MEFWQIRVHVPIRLQLVGQLGQLSLDEPLEVVKRLDVLRVRGKSLGTVLLDVSVHPLSPIVKGCSRNQTKIVNLRIEPAGSFWKKIRHVPVAPDQRSDLVLQAEVGAVTCEKLEGEQHPLTVLTVEDQPDFATGEIVVALLKDEPEEFDEIS